MGKKWSTGGRNTNKKPFCMATNFFGRSKIFKTRFHLFIISFKLRLSTPYPPFSFLTFLVFTFSFVACSPHFLEVTLFSLWAERKTFFIRQSFSSTKELYSLFFARKKKLFPSSYEKIIWFTSSFFFFFWSLLKYEERMIARECVRV